MPSQQVLDEKSSEVEAIKDFPASGNKEKHGWQSLPARSKEYADEDSD